MRPGLGLTLVLDQFDPVAVGAESVSSTVARATRTSPTAKACANSAVVSPQSSSTVPSQAIGARAATPTEASVLEEAAGAPLLTMGVVTTPTTSNSRSQRTARSSASATTWSATSAATPQSGPSGGGAPLVGSLYVPSAYKVPCYAVRTLMVVSNKPPYEAYRGYGKDLSNMPMERILDRAAEKLGIDPIELRRRNLVDTFPHTMPSGPIIENGTFAECLDLLVESMDLPRLRPAPRALGEVRRPDGRRIVTPAVDPEGRLDGAPRAWLLGAGAQRPRTDHKR